MRPCHFVLHSNKSLISDGVRTGTVQRAKYMKEDVCRLLIAIKTLYVILKFIMLSLLINLIITIITVSVPIMTCTACNARSCFVHDLPIHSGLQCDQCKAEEDEANAEKEEANKKKAEKASEGFLQQQTKPCPKCKSRIIKNGGCDHMVRRH